MRAKRQNKKPKLEREVRPGFSLVEQMTGIEPASSAWEAEKNRLYHSIKSPFLNFFDLHLTCIE